MRTVLITGCSSGIGRATATYLAGRGWQVLASARRLESIEDLRGPQIDVLQLDVTDEASCVQGVATVLERVGRLDALVNNAAISAGGPLELQPLDYAHYQFETNLWGPLRLCQLAAPAMRAQGGGRIVNVTSVLGRMSVPYSGLYAASKHALEAISDSLRLELYPWHIRVSLVEPGFVRTRFGQNSKPWFERFTNHPLYRGYLKQDAENRSTLPRGSDPVGVARVIERALTDRNPRARYAAGWDARAALFALPFIPDRVIDWGMLRFYRLHKSAPSDEPGEE